jgi:predicted HNH restriction endonuclease
MAGVGARVGKASISMKVESMSAWGQWFRDGELLRSEIKASPFRILNIATDGIQVQAPTKKGRRVLLSYEHLDALWSSRNLVSAAIRKGGPANKKALTVTVNRIWERQHLKLDHTNESQYWAFVCERARRQEGPLGPDIDLEAVEGEPRLVTHLRRERAPDLVAKKKAAVLKTAGRLACEACGFNFAEHYPGLGSNFCEVHHTQALGKGTGARITKLSDLAVLCANCHRMIHRTIPMDSVDKFRKRLNGAG